MQKYELLLVLPGTFDEKEAENEANKVVGIVNEFGQQVVLNVLGKNRLAYPIRQIRYGYFYTIVFEIESKNLKELKNKLDLDKNILRSFITKYNAKIAAEQKISYFNELKEAKEKKEDEEEEIKPVVVKEETKEEKKEEKAEEKPMDLKDIDKKLDEILADDNLMTKV